jgi:beta-glucanase (GH16 family)
MTRRSAGLFALGVFLQACGSTNGPLTPASSPTPPSSWTLVWSDEFEGLAGATVDATRWRFDVGGGGWGNQELQSYTDRARNAHLSGDGALVIDVLREGHTGPDGIPREFTSARLKTQGTFAETYGRFEARLKVPHGQGIWPAFWMLGTDITSAGWPACGEIDVMEHIGREPALVHGTIHGPGYSGGSGIGSAFTLPAGRFADDFHVFAVEWDRDVLRWYVDGQLYLTRTPAHLPTGTRWVFDHPFFLILNVAVGGTWPGPPDATTVFPQRMLVDYVRVYRKGSGLELCIGQTNSQFQT